jgi:hypothetical protein
VPYMPFSGNEIDNPSKLPCMDGRPMQQWCRIITRYTSNDLTYLADKLRAVSAIAEVYKQSTGQSHLAGLWTGVLPQELCWALSKSTS